MAAKVSMIATEEQEYPIGRKVHPGDDFEADAPDVDLLIALGRAKRREQPAQEYRTRELRAAPGRRNKG
jgi:hypothetical protein